MNELYDNCYRNFLTKCVIFVISDSHAKQRQWLDFIINIIIN